jgi:hypothetical protein
MRSEFLALVLLLLKSIQILYTNSVHGRPYFRPDCFFQTLNARLYESESWRKIRRRTKRDRTRKGREEHEEEGECDKNTNKITAFALSLNLHRSINRSFPISDFPSIWKGYTRKICDCQATSIAMRQYHGGVPYSRQVNHDSKSCVTEPVFIHVLALLLYPQPEEKSVYRTWWLTSTARKTTIDKLLNTKGMA